MQINVIMNHPARSLLLVRFILIIGFYLITANSYGGNKMEPLYPYDLKGAETLKPQEFSSNHGLFSQEYSSISLFPVPRDNAVGTSYMNNAITLISFPKGQIKFDKYFKNAVDDLGSGQYMPVIDQDMIGLGQTRSFIIYDFKKKIHREYYITKSIANTIERIATADARKRHFIFEMEKGSNSPDPWAGSNVLLLVDLSSREPRVIKEIKSDNVTVWSVVGDKNFLLDLKTMHTQVLNMNLEPSQHPLADKINKNKATVDFVQIIAHTTLPFAVLSGGAKGSFVVSWRNSGGNSPLLLIESATQFSFSPDGKWVTLKKNNYDKDTVTTCLMPVSEKYPHYLGSPIMLFEKDFDNDNFAWTSNPVSFVGSYMKKIYRWDLDNQPHPGSDKMSFHDYIVERDLEKLTRERRQGLGEKHK